MTAKFAYQNGRQTIINKLGEYHKTINQMQKAVNEYEIISSSLPNTTDLPKYTHFQK